jgi:hypothetical protein
LRGEDFDGQDAVDEPPGSGYPASRDDAEESPETRPQPRRHRDPRDGDVDADGSVPPERRRNRVDSQDSGYRARRQADMQEDVAKPRVRRRADFDGPDWDVPDAPKQEQPSELSGAFRFALDLTLLGFESLKFKRNVPLALGIDRTIASYGLTENAGFGLLVGYGVTDNFVLNARLILTNTNTAFGEASGTDQARFQISPSLEYVFGEPASGARPFVGALAGLVIGDTPAGATALTELSFVLAGQLGIHLFPAKHVSFDPALQVGYRVGSASSDTGTTATNVDYKLTGVVLLLTLGLSYWS